MSRVTPTIIGVAVIILTILSGAAAQNACPSGSPYTLMGNLKVLGTIEAENVKTTSSWSQCIHVDSGTTCPDGKTLVTAECRPWAIKGNPPQCSSVYSGNTVSCTCGTVPTNLACC